MGCLIVAFLVLALIFAGFGFVTHVLWILAAVFFVCWVAGYGFSRGRRRGGRTGGWGRPGREGRTRGWR